MIQYTAHSAGVETHVGEGFDYVMTGLSEGEDGSGRGLTIQCALADPDAGDIEQGMDSYCVSNELGLTVYGGVRAVRLRDRSMRIEFEPRAAGELGLDDPVVEVELAVDDESIEQLRAGLRQTLSYGRERSRPVMEL
ncbi:MAG TPA: Imm10 family immunity protein [Candidatus Limnocylindrales bacterium]